VIILTCAKVAHEVIAKTAAAMSGARNMFIVDASGEIDPWCTGDV
jgi:hypothetical protein